jgi:hypothetical protein
MIKVKDERTRYEVVWDNRVFKTYRYGAFVGNCTLERGNIPEKQAQKKAEEILKKLADSVPLTGDEDAGDYI